MWSVEEDVRHPGRWVILWEGHWGTGYEWKSRSLAESACRAMNDNRELDERTAIENERRENERRYRVEAGKRSTEALTELLGRLPAQAVQQRRAIKAELATRQEASDE